jgi:hypothetical protein
MGPSRPWERPRLRVLITGLKTGLNRLLAGLPKQYPMLGGQPGRHRPPNTCGCAWNKVTVVYNSW